MDENAKSEHIDDDDELIEIDEDEKFDEFEKDFWWPPSLNKADGGWKSLSIPRLLMMLGLFAGDELNMDGVYVNVEALVNLLSSKSWVPGMDISLSVSLLLKLNFEVDLCLFKIFKFSAWDVIVVKEFDLLWVFERELFPKKWL